ncbi:hypothetical protein NEOKW01_1178 [Nematocida sp. AWRm80]|nr:hypothetical protein NEOKW01_1178 [Nematocida sp. AWRm80]
MKLLLIVLFTLLIAILLSRYVYKRPKTIYILGERGIGKTRLVLYLTKSTKEKTLPTLDRTEYKYNRRVYIDTPGEEYSTNEDIYNKYPNPNAIYLYLTNKPTKVNTNKNTLVIRTETENQNTNVNNQLEKNKLQRIEEKINNLL